MLVLQLHFKRRLKDVVDIPSLLAASFSCISRED